jgi:RNA polymerase sigma factor (sigma-70 family)
MAQKAKIFGKDGNLSALMKQHGIHTVTELAKRCDMPLPSISGAVNGKRAAIFAEEPGTYRQPARRIAEVLGVIPEILFGEDPRDDERRRHAEGVFGELHPSVPPLDPEQELGRKELGETTTRILASLQPNPDQVMRMRFGVGMDAGRTLEEVGQQFSVTRERIRQIEAKALRKLKHPSRSGRLRSFLDT